MSDYGLISRCHRLDPPGKQPKLHQALCYAELLKASTPKHPAFIFARKQHCRYDATRQRDGPAVSRALQPLLRERHDSRGWLAFSPLLTQETAMFRRLEEDAWLEHFVAVVRGGKSPPYGDRRPKSEGRRHAKGGAAKPRACAKGPEGPLQLSSPRAFGPKLQAVENLRREVREIGLERSDPQNACKKLESGPKVDAEAQNLPAFGKKGSKENKSIGFFLRGKSGLSNPSNSNQNIREICRATEILGLAKKQKRVNFDFKTEIFQQIRTKSKLSYKRLHESRNFSNTSEGTAKSKKGLFQTM